MPEFDAELDTLFLDALDLDEDLGDTLRYLGVTVETGEG